MKFIFDKTFLTHHLNFLTVKEMSTFELHSDDSAFNRGYTN